MDELIYYDLRDTPRLSHSLATQLARDLGKQIVAGKYPESSLIEDEGTLAEKNRVSRSVIRDAVKILVGKGMLEVRRGIGTRVRSRESWGLLDDDVLSWHQAATPNPRFLQQLMDFRLLFEPKAARWAAERGTEFALKAIEEAQLRMEAEQGSVEDFIVADASYHRAILRAANNEFVRAMEGLVFSSLIISMQISNADPRKNEDSVALHREVTDAILKRDGPRAEAGIETMLLDAMTRLKGHMHDA